MNQRARRKRRKDLLGALFLVLAVLAVLTAIYLYQRLSSGAVAFDRLTLCPVDGPRSLTVVLVDTTDPLDAVQKEDVSKRLDDIKEKDVPRWGELELFTVRPTPADRLLRPELTVCNPGRGSEISPFYGNPALVEKRWRKQFSDKTDEVLGRLLGSQSAESSPILESIQQAAVEAFLGRRVAQVPKRLVVVSDMLQHTSCFSQYHGFEPFDSFCKSPCYLKVRPNLAGVDVTILYLRRAQAARIQGRRHIEFWQQYFKDAGATVTEVVSIEG